MSKIISTTTINACFLAIVLIVGTFAAISPSFMIGAHAQQYGMEQKYNSHEPDYGMDSSYDDKQSYGKEDYSDYKSKDSSSSVSVKKIKCNNINVNLNGFNGVEVGTLPTALNGLATDEAQASDEGEIGASSSGSGERNNNGYQHNDKDSRYVCINNNDFAVVEEEEEPAISECEKCFSALQAVIENSLISVTEDITIGIGLEEIRIPGEVDTIQQLCPLLEGHTDFFVSALIDIIVEQQTDTTALIECLLKAGVIIEEIP